VRLNSPPIEHAEHHRHQRAGETDGQTDEGGQRHIAHAQRELCPG